MPFNIKQMDQSNWVCYHMNNNSYYFGQVGYLDQSGIVLPKDNIEAANNVKNKLVKHGFGVFISKLNHQTNTPQSTYQGYWEKDSKSGKGYLKRSNGLVYQGNFHQDHFHGTGKMTWQNNDTYQGAWKRSKMDGAGTFKNHSGFVLKGIFKSNYFADDQILRNPQMSEKQYIAFKKQRKQILKQKQKQERIKDGFMVKILASNQELLKQKLNLSVKNNRVPLVLSSKKSNFTFDSFTQSLAKQFSDTKINIFDLRKAHCLKNNQKQQYRQQIHEMFRNSLIKGQIFIINLDQSDVNFEQMYYPDIKQFYQPNGLNHLAWSRDQLNRPEVKNKIIQSQAIHQNYKLIVWTKYKLDSSITQDFLRQKVQIRFQKIIPFVKIDCVFLTQQPQNEKPEQA